MIKKICNLTLLFILLVSMPKYSFSDIPSYNPSPPNLGPAPPVKGNILVNVNWPTIPNLPPSCMLLDSADASRLEVPGLSVYFTQKPLGNTILINAPDTQGKLSADPDTHYSIIGGLPSGTTGFATAQCACPDTDSVYVAYYNVLINPLSIDVATDAKGNASVTFDVTLQNDPYWTNQVTGCGTLNSSPWNN